MNIIDIDNLKQYLDTDDIKKMRNLQVKGSCDYSYSEEDEYAHWMDGKLIITFESEEKKNEKLSIIYSEEQGCHTENRYSPTVTQFDFKATKKAKELLLKNLDIKENQQDWDNDDFRELGDMIKSIANNSN